MGTPPTDLTELTDQAVEAGDTATEIAEETAE